MFCQAFRTDALYFLHIAGALEHHGTDVAVVDMFAEVLSAEQVLSRVREYQPDLVGMTVLTPSEPICSALSEMIRAALPSVKIVWGAVHAEVFAKDIVLEKKADFVVHHDGEESICDFGRFRMALKIFSSIDGLTWLGDDGTPVTNKDRRPRIWILFRIQPALVSIMGSTLADFAKPVLTMTGSGCPYRCDYCSLINTGVGIVAVIRSRLSMNKNIWLIDTVKQIGFVDPIFP